MGLKCLGECFREARKDQRYSLDEMASMLQMSKSHLWEIEKGRTHASFGVVFRIVRVLGIDMDDVCRRFTIPEEYEDE
jgi:transcriptional regulator with XRE-family HTH domain